MHKLLVGIEHVMTGVQFKSDSPITFERESPSMLRVLSDTKIEAYWSVKQTFLESTEEQTKPQEFSYGEAEYYAQVFGHALRGTDGWAVDQAEMKGGKRPDEVIVKAMRRKFGAHADKHIAELKYDGLNRCYYFVHAGMYHGVEDDGYIHT